MSIQTSHGEQAGERRRRLGLGGLAVAIALAATMAVAEQANAAEGVGSYAGRVSAGETITVSCPEGYAVVAGPLTYADFYRTERGPGVPLVLAVQPGGYIRNEAGYAVAATWTVPKGARWATAYVSCATLTTPLVQMVALSAGGEAVVLCGSPYVVDESTVAVDQPGITWTVEGSDIRLSNPGSQAVSVVVTATCRLIP